MNPKKKIALIIAAVFAAAGIIALFAACLLIQFDFTRLNTMKFEAKTHEVSESFHNISISDLECDVIIVPTDNDLCRVVCYETSKIINTVEVKDDTLLITRQDKRSWYEHFGIWWTENNTVTLYLPEREYEYLYVKTVSGEISIADSFTFCDTKLLSTSGDIVFTGNSRGDLFAKTTSGNITLKNSQAKTAEVRSTSGDISFTGDIQGDLLLKSTSGDIRLQNSRAGRTEAYSTSGDCSLSELSIASLTLKTTSGGIKAQDVTAEGHAELVSTSGDIRLDKTDAASFFIKSTSGDVKGSLLSGKNFITHTSSGSVQTPASIEGSGTCEIKTSSGDIRIDVVS
ncbi:MAG: DUF4097 domain-containing protein [Clostridiales bacterium]|nr:DUF4097 domain-containing protein [Clostridiales bacterium]